MDNSPLRKLPAELRNYIAGLAMRPDDDDGRVHIWHSRKHTPLNDLEIRKFDRTTLKNPFALAQTCKELRANYVDLFYQAKTFFLHRSPMLTSAVLVKSFLDAIGGKRAAVMEGLVFSYGTSECVLNEISSIAAKNFFRFQLQGLVGDSSLAQVLKGIKRAEVSIEVFICPIHDHQNLRVEEIRLDYFDMRNAIATESVRINELKDKEAMTADCRELYKELSIILKQVTSEIFDGAKE